mmetsp:Transcript_28605/g.92268  ORF Transcript_28605/g.92268 Transcript_28605/m.92268 type:complete len:219 (-) Transcript_28605:566-1222(-)
MHNRKRSSHFPLVAELLISERRPRKGRSEHVVLSATEKKLSLLPDFKPPPHQFLGLVVLDDGGDSVCGDERRESLSPRAPECAGDELNETIFRDMSDLKVFFRHGHVEQSDDAEVEDADVRMGGDEDVWKRENRRKIDRRHIGEHLHNLSPLIFKGRNLLDRLLMLLRNLLQSGSTRCYKTLQLFCPTSQLLEVAPPLPQHLQPPRQPPLGALARCSC